METHLEQGLSILQMKRQGKTSQGRELACV